MTPGWEDFTTPHRKTWQVRQQFIGLLRLIGAPVGSLLD
jgi:hypothetical protein